ncbi:bifunctional YncE family protein/alkaline phosphatase family protein [Aneurinibacillus sp. Ricciae_BoGa-3]|uniref:bifunctional YncE family protein/alkaline phosphatase family protein n=1 Tax=Aneurinibacillus sp. Ricciae_BoGa-3 TaxID=3022697 RepID=UPI002341DC16|nr:bifunctional YncE family protein/alkaline phosphatase family protein [Aneurinibacillus sp. Ricciae_BoGa-3]WCK54152.1 bifunctional YncE family protein/alkaline phosphatase family protein [Aneurinibacillus sp. Ricciae_BoGa-3]
MKCKGNKRKKMIAGIALATVLVGSSTAFAASMMVAGPQGNGTGVTPNHWMLTPAGKQLNLGNKPFGAAVSPDHRYLIVSNDGSPKSLQVVDLQQQKVVSEVKPPEGLYIGVAFSPDGKTVYASGTKNKIAVFNFDNGVLKEQNPIVMKNAGSNTTYSPAGISVSADGKTLIVANNLNQSVSRVDLATGQLTATTPVGKNPYMPLITSDGNTIYVSNWGESSVSVLDAKDLTVKKSIPVGLHPNAMIQNPVNGLIYVANSDSDEISVINPDTQAVVKTISLSPYQGAPTGSQPNALAVSKDGNTLYVSNAGNNDIAVIDLGEEKGKSEPAIKGLIPTAWYPSGVFLSEDGKQLMVLNAKGLGAGPNAQHQYIGSLINGTMSFIDVPDNQSLKKYTKQVEENNQMDKTEGSGWLKQLEGKKSDPIPRFAGGKSPIKHAIYVIKENRTYDQVLGDLKRGNGDASLTEFGQTITPNQHKLATQFVTLDNFYVDGECSADGHDWTTAAKANDYKEKGYRASDHIYDFRGQDPADYSKEGHLWNNAAKSGVSFRNYGEFMTFNKTQNQWTPTDSTMQNNYDPLYPGWDLNTRDVVRYNEWEKEFKQFEQNDNLPQLEMVYLPNDHTSGTTAGKQTPQAMVAENDYVLGKLVDTVSHSKYWKDTAIFVVEDDAQAGPDHVDAHRTIAQVISPYTQIGKVDSTFYDTASMIKTMELILGMKPMSQFDAAATPMLNAFTNRPNLAPYAVENPQYPIDAINGQSTPAVAVSKPLDFSAPDAANTDELNHQIWKATKGNKPYPVKG